MLDFVENYIPHTEKVVNEVAAKGIGDRTVSEPLLPEASGVESGHIFDFDEMNNVDVSAIYDIYITFAIFVLYMYGTK